jgi:hypothetical protein
LQTLQPDTVLGKQIWAEVSVMQVPLEQVWSPPHLVLSSAQAVPLELQTLQTDTELG